MKKLIFIFSLSFFTHLLFSQDWHPVTPNGVYHYTNQNTSYATHTIFADSFKTDSNKTTYYLNRVPIKCDTCEWLDKYCRSSNNQYRVYFGIFILEGGQFLKKQIEVNNDGTIILKDSFNCLLKIYAPVNATWMYDSSTLRLAKIISRSKANILGETDSIITYYISGGENIVLSKKHGIIRFPDFENSGTFELIGVEGNKNGYNMPKVDDIMGFGTGDMFRYQRLYTGDSNTSKHSYNQFEVINKYSKNDSLFIEVEGAEHQFYPRLDYYKYSKTLTYPKYSLPDYEFYKFKKLYNYQVLANEYTDEVVYVRLGENENGEFTIVLTGINGEKSFYDKPLVPKATFFNDFPNVYKNFIVSKYSAYSYSTYQPKLGLVKSGFMTDGGSGYYELLGCRINNIVYGELNSINESQNPINLKIYPNPVQDILKIDLSEKTEESTLSIFNTNGQLVFERTGLEKMNSIDLTGFPSGIYILQISTKADKKTYKFVKN